MNDLISVIIPVKNGTNYIHEAIEGLRNQNMNIEIIVVDDMSADGTVKVAESMGCLVLKHDKQKGQVAGKNTGIKAAKGGYILFHDHDDIMNENVLSKMYDELINDATLFAVMAKVKDFISPDAMENNNAEIKQEAYWGLLTGAVLIKKEVFDIIGFFDEKLTTGEIIGLQSKMELQGLKIKKLDIISTNRRVHNTNYGKTSQKREFQDYARALREKLALRK